MQLLIKEFKEYRSRVIERFGEEVDRELKYNLKAKKFDETVIDEETGKEKKVKKNGFVVSPGDISGYARFFEKYTQDEDGNSILNPLGKATMNIICVHQSPRALCKRLVEMQRSAYF